MLTSSDRTSAGTYGDCQDCGRRHELSDGNARAYALEMMRELKAIRRLDYRVPKDEAEPQLSFENLFSHGRGNMFGVLECVDARGQTVFLRAFSSLWDGIRQVEGWVLPLLSAEVYERTILPAQDVIKAMTVEMKGLEAETAAYVEVQNRRKGVSQTLWEEMCAAYRFRNFRGEERSLEEAVSPGAPIPGGVGECCAPKLLNHAARHGLRPRGLVEFYWGEDRRRTEEGGRISGEFYPSCEARCRPILGFMLCGIEE